MAVTTRTTFPLNQVSSIALIVDPNQQTQALRNGQLTNLGPRNNTIDVTMDGKACDVANQVLQTLSTDIQNAPPAERNALYNAACRITGQPPHPFASRKVTALLTCLGTMTLANPTMRQIAFEQYPYIATPLFVGCAAAHGLAIYKPNMLSNITGALLNMTGSFRQAGSKFLAACKNHPRKAAAAAALGTAFLGRATIKSIFREAAIGIVRGSISLLKAKGSGRNGINSTP